MVSLWNRKKDHGDEDGPENREESSTPVREPDERTRLIPREPVPVRELPRETQGYLSPDDPAVSIALCLYSLFQAPELTCVPHF